MAFSLEQILASHNLATQMSEAELSHLGREVVQNFEKDKRSRADWEKRQADALELALQVVKTKTFPWPNASNVKFPLITIAALQYHARAYPALIDGPEIVKMRVTGEDKTGQAEARANRVSKYMSYQVIEEDEEWEDQMDKVLITQPIVGCAFKKTYRNIVGGHNVSENILADDLVVPYYTKSLETAARISHVIRLSDNEIYERVVNGTFLDVDFGASKVPVKTTLQISAEKREGVTSGEPDESLPKEFIEQHVSLDLDSDGYKEPYIVVVHKESKQVVRIVARFVSNSVKYAGEKILRIDAENYFTKYPFIPSPDGGFYDLGFGALLGPLNESINTLINQLIDAGTMSVTGGGFLSRGIKIRGGTQAFTPNEWKSVESTGDDLRKGILPLPVREPNQVLFTLLSLLINYGERIGGSVDILVGENPGQNTPAETSRTMAEQGMKIFSGIYKRTRRSLKEEFRKLYRLNHLFITKKVSIGDLVVLPEDFDEDQRNIVPAADPKMISDSQKMQKANLLHSVANPMFGYNMYEVHLRLLKAYGIEEPDKVLPDPKGPNAMPPFKPPQVMVEELKGQAKLQVEQVKSQTAKEKVKADISQKIAELQNEAALNEAKIDQLQAQALLALEQADSETSKIEIAAIDAQIGMQRSHQEHLLKAIELMHNIAQDKKEKANGGNTGGVS